MQGIGFPCILTYYRRILRSRILFCLLTGGTDDEYTGNKKEVKENRGVRMNFETISAKSIDEYIGREDCIIIDLREREEYDRGHIRGAYHLTFEELEQSVPVRRDVTYILYCERGASSMMAAKRLAREGYRVKTVIGGILAYRGRNMVYEG